ncbi:MAG TPA: endo-1,4-beta-xylanase, partial [Actinoplanes sp.]|nr:endo-1,4-beta-xylanase [Actinoplanes sp.]
MWMWRSFTVGLAAVLVGGLGWGGTASAEGTALRDLARAKGITFGTAVSAPALTGDEDYRARLKTEFSAVTTEDALKWAVTEPEKGVFKWAAADAIVDAAVENGQEVRGHTLVWHSSLPSWLAKETALEKTLEDHITTTVSRFKGRVDVWDVVNEPLANDGTLRPGLWLDNLEAGYIAAAFRWADAADPDAKLYLNEYGAETPGPKADALYDLVKGLKDAKVPIDGVGFQAHLTGSSQATALAGQLRRFADLGVDVAVTELDVRVPAPATPAGRAEQAEVYGQVVAACLTLPGRCRSVTVWGFAGGHSWIPAAYPGWGDATLLDADLNATDAYREVTGVLSAAGPAADAPVGDWPLGDTGGADVSGHRRDAVVRGTTTAGRVPHVTAFAGDGAGTEASVGGPVVDTAGGFTVSAWVSLASTKVAGVIA